MDLLLAILVIVFLLIDIQKTSKQNRILKQTLDVMSVSLKEYLKTLESEGNENGKK